MTTSKRFRRSFALAIILGAVVGGFWLVPSKLTASILIGILAILSVVMEWILDFALGVVSEE